MGLKDISIKWQLLVMCVILVTIPVVTLGLLSYNASHEVIFEEIEQRLSQQAIELAFFAESVHTQIVANEEAIEDQVHASTRSQAEAVYHFIETFPNQEEHLKEAIGNIKVGETGYIYIVDYDGNMLYHPVNPALIGTNMMFSEDDDGDYFIKEQIDVGRTLAKGEIDFSKYTWKNEGETEARDKIAAILHVPSKEWIVVVSTYYDELVDVNFETNNIESFKDEISQIVVGQTGYVFILDEEGNYVLSLNKERDGENIWGAKDADGNFMIQEIIEKATALDHGESDIHYYPWLNTGETEARMKVAGLSYVPERNWIIGASAYHDDFLTGLNEIRRMTVLVSVIAILAGSIIAYLFAQFMTSTFKGLIEKMNTVASGDLRVNVDDKNAGKNELGQMTTAFKAMLDNLKNLVSTIKKSVSQSAANSEELSASSEEVNSSMQQISSTVQQIAKGAQDLSTNVNNVSNQSKAAGESAKKGSEATGTLKSKMQTINETTKTGANKVSELGEKSGKIGEIIETINNISEQTNLLALNAAIEAARAGDAGRGFAVVADEVRKLAEESQKATGLISELIKEIQDAINDSVNTMNDNTKQVEDGSAAVNDAISSLEQIPGLVEKLNSSIAEISAVAEENAAGSEEVTASVEQVTSAIQQVSEGAQQLSASSEELRNVVEKFKIDGVSSGPGPVKPSPVGQNKRPDFRAAKIPEHKDPDAENKAGSEKTENNVESQDATKDNPSN
ncbi:MAG: methyl-accepting chemotaxis protein [Candidatus Woesearchaeota archaeon]